MSVTPTLNLFVDNEQTPYYWVDVVLPSGSDYETHSHGDLPTTVNSAGHFPVNVHLVAYNNGSQTIQVDLGEIPIHPVNGEIHVDLLDHQQNSVGGGVVRTENAKESSRPIGIGSVS